MVSPSDKRSAAAIKSCAGGALPVAHPEGTEYELRLATNSDGFNRYVQNNTFTKKSIRTDYYFDFLVEDKLMLRGTGGNPVKLRIKQYESNALVLQCSRRLDRILPGEHKSDLPVTLTAFDAPSIRVPNKHGRPLISAFNGAVKSFDSGKPKAVRRELLELRKVFDLVLDQNPFSEVAEIFELARKQGGVLVPLYTNVKKKSQHDVVLDGVLFSVKARQVEYEPAGLNPYKLYEIKAEAERPTDWGQMQIAAKALNIHLKRSGIEETNLPRDNFNPSMRTVTAINQIEEPRF